MQSAGRRRWLAKIADQAYSRRFLRKLAPMALPIPAKRFAMPDLRNADLHRPLSPFAHSLGHIAFLTESGT